MGKGKRRNELRADMRKVIASLDRRWIEVASREVCSHLTYLIDELLDWDTEHVLAWMPYFPGEMDLTPFITEQLTRRKVYLPRILPDYRMSFLEITSDWLTQMVHEDLGIPEPRSGAAYDPVNASSTVVVVPGLAFDASGNRMGRGKGFYDRFLARAGMGATLKVGVCWTLQMVDEIPAESHDIMMDWVCHERDLLRTGLDSDEEITE